MISIILPSIRPHLVADCLNAIKQAADGVSHEVVVVADYVAPVNHNPWIVSERRGVVDAVNVAWKYAVGDVLFLTNDQTNYGPSAIRLLYEAVTRSPETLFCPRHEPFYPFYYYGKFFAAFPCASRALYQRLGGMLDPVYRAFYSDPDLSLRAHEAGVPITQVDEAVIYHRNYQTPESRESVKLYRADDQRVFRARWDHLGEFRDP